jgi:hypothetical protein
MVDWYFAMFRMPHHHTQDTLIPAGINLSLLPLFTFRPPCFPSYVRPVWS